MSATAESESAPSKPPSQEGKSNDGNEAQDTETSSDAEGQHDAAKAAAKQAAQAAEKRKPTPVTQHPSTRNNAANRRTPPSGKLAPNWDSPVLRVPRVGFPWIEHHGYLRMRTDLFYNFDLGTYDRLKGIGTSPFLPALTEIDANGNLHPEQLNQRFAQDAESLSSANIRFRYQPTIHVSETLRINSTLDILDNFVLGGSPLGGPHASRVSGSDADVYALPDPSVGLFNDSQKPTDSGINGMRDSIRVKHLWGEWVAPLGSLAFGRMPNHWGLGILANAGQCLDCDFGDSVDRLMGTVLLLDTYLSVGWDFADEGAIGFSGDQTFRNQPFGQPYDFEQRDDVSQYTIAIFRRPVSNRERQLRQRKLYEERALTFDWGLYNVIRSQTLEAGYSVDGLTPDDPTQYQLFEVDGFTYSPDLWMDFNWVPSANSTYRLQLEVVGVFGGLNEVPQQYGLDASICVDGSDPQDSDCDLINQRERDINRFGYALEFDAKHGAFEWGFHHGLASGDKDSGFGYLSDSEIKSPESQQLNPDQSLTALRFDRDYHVDLILFRELIGGVTNATYFKPYLGYRFVDHPTEVWGFNLSTIYGYALEADATPGEDPSLGFEIDLEFYIHEIDRFQLRFMYGLLIPLGAFDLIDPTSKVVLREASTAQTLQALIGVEF